MNRCSVAVGCPAARPGPAPQRRSPDERQDNCYISLESSGRRVIAGLTCGGAVTSRDEPTTSSPPFPARPGTVQARRRERGEEPALAVGEGRYASGLAISDTRKQGIW